MGVRFTRQTIFDPRLHYQRHDSSDGIFACAWSKIVLANRQQLFICLCQTKVQNEVELRMLATKEENFRASDSCCIVNYRRETHRGCYIYAKMCKSRRWHADLQSLFSVFIKFRIWWLEARYLKRIHETKKVADRKAYSPAKSKKGDRIHVEHVFVKIEL